MEPDDATEPRYGFEMTMRDRQRWYDLALVAGFPRRERKRKKRPVGIVGTLPQHEIRHSPTSEEIREACAVIQSEWSEAEELSRRADAYRRVEWVLPENV